MDLGNIRITPVDDVFDGRIGFDILQQRTDPYGTAYWVAVKSIRKNPVAAEDVAWYRVLSALFRLESERDAAWEQIDKDAETRGD